MESSAPQLSLIGKQDRRGKMAHMSQSRYNLWSRIPALMSWSNFTLDDVAAAYGWLVFYAYSNLQPHMVT